MYITFQPMSKQRGAATLVVSLILLLAITLMTFSGVRVAVSEQRISANDLRAKQATTVAEALVENGIAYLEANKTYINNSVDAAGWLNDPVGTAVPLWQACANATKTVPCGNGDANVYNNTWLYYTPTAALIPSVSSGVYSAAYTESVSFVTPNLGVGGALAIADYPLIYVIANVSPGADPLAGSAQVKQTVQGVKLSKNIPQNAIVAQSQVPLSGSQKIWGNPTGLETTVLRTVTVPAGTAADADYIVYYNNEPSAVSLNVGLWINTTVTNLTDESLATFFETVVNPSTINLTINNNASYPDDTTTPIGSVTIGLRARSTTGDEFLDWGLSVAGGAAIFDTVSGIASVPVTLTSTWTDYYKTWKTNPATNAAWTRAQIATLQAQLKATQNGGTMGNVQVAEVWVDGYRGRYTVPILDSVAQTVVEKGFPLSITTRGSLAASTGVTLSGSINTCRNWSNPTTPVAETTPYAQWYPGGSGPSCNGSEILSSSGYIDVDVKSSVASIPVDIFNYVFGVPQTEYQTVKNQAVVLANCTTITAASKGLFWITGDCDLPNAGTANDPVTIVVQGDFQGNSNTIFTGLIYSFTLPGAAPSGAVRINGNAVIIGGIVSDHFITSGNGSLALVYSRSVLQRASSTFGGFAKIPGGWTDQL